jgi:hypothetical protein
VTKRTPEARVREFSEGVEAGTFVTAHTHMQFDRRVAVYVSSTRAASGSRTSSPGAYWALLGPDVELRRTDYDVEDAIAQMLATDDPRAELIAEMMRTPPDQDEVIDDAERRVFRRLTSRLSRVDGDCLRALALVGSTPEDQDRVHSYYLPAERVLIDPIEPEDGLDWFAEHGPPEHVLLTNRHHYRASGEFADRFGVTVHCVREGVHEFGRDRQVEPFGSATSSPAGSSRTRSERSAPTRPRCTSPPTRLSPSRTGSALGGGMPRSRSCPTTTWTRRSRRSAVFARRITGSWSSISATCCWRTASRSWATAATR